MGTHLFPDPLNRLGTRSSAQTSPMESQWTSPFTTEITETQRGWATTARVFTMNPACKVRREMGEQGWRQGWSMFLEPQECHLGEHSRSCFPEHVISLAQIKLLRKFSNNNNKKGCHLVKWLGGDTDISNVGMELGRLYPRWPAVFREMEMV